MLKIEIINIRTQILYEPLNLYSPLGARGLFTNQNNQYRYLNLYRHDRKD